MQDSEIKEKIAAHIAKIKFCGIQKNLVICDDVVLYVYSNLKRANIYHHRKDADKIIELIVGTLQYCGVNHIAHITGL